MCTVFKTSGDLSAFYDNGLFNKKICKPSLCERDVNRVCNVYFGTLLGIRSRKASKLDCNFLYDCDMIIVSM